MGFVLYNEDCLLAMRRLAPESVDCVVTSPPYWNQRAYASWPTYEDYLADADCWLAEIARVLKPGRHAFWNIPDKLPYPPKQNGSDERLYLSIYSDTERLAAASGLLPEFPIVWDKMGHGAQKMFGSYPYPPSVIHTPTTERICVWRKPGQAELPPDGRKAASQYTKAQWVAWATDVWRIAPETNVKWHPAPFPREIPYRLLTLWTYVGDTVLDPFAGSGTTGIVCGELNREFVGAERDPEYYARAYRRIQTAYESPTLFDVNAYA